ncbi:hypothetical protein FB008_11242 [Sinorhizobium medicae]|nr:hypothetical protein FB008_11242 [Sinorhizobium medicae]
MMGPCIVCGTAAEIGRSSDAHQYRCDRCGPFLITGTAVAVLKGRTQPTGTVNELIVAKVSHYIRTHSTEGAWLEIDSSMIDEMVAQKLPSPNQQIANLLRWMAEQVGEDHLAALEFSATDVCAIMGAASVDSASDLIDEASNSGLIQFVPDDCYRLTKAAWDRLAASELPHIPPQQRGDFVDSVRMAELREISDSQFDLTRLVRMCEEINSAWRAGNLISVAMLARAMVDHVPPIFGQTNFSQVTSQASRSVRGSFEHIQTGLRHIADSALHTHIRRRETIPTATQVDFRQSFDVLLGELVRILRS